MKRQVKWLLIAVLAIDAVAVAALIGSDPIRADGGRAVAAAEVAPELSPEALRLLSAELALRAEELSRREVEIDELMRAGDVLARAGINPAASDDAKPEPVDPRRAQAFASLGRAYENMEPDSAARALTELAARDKQAVVQLLLGWQPRTSGAILDALAQSGPELAADLSYEIWQLSGGGN
jgi:flagellar motility protein MotE (MotC chaperone)